MRLLFLRPSRRRREREEYNGDRLLAVANERLRQDNKKAIEEHEEDRTQKVVTRGNEDDRSRRRGPAVWPASLFLRKNTARRGQGEDFGFWVALWSCLVSASL